MEKRHIVLDTETTGLEVEKGHRIIEIGGVVMNGRKKTTETFHVYVNPQREIDKEARHGIDLKEFDGIHVVCAKDGAVITTYRNKSFRGAREGLGEKRHFPMKRFYAEISI